MDIDAIISELNVTPAELARRLNVSDGHIWDLKSGRRKLSLKLAAKIEKVTGRRGLVAEVVKSRTAA